jgi:hypothetical protein
MASKPKDFLRNIRMLAIYFTAMPVISGSAA